MVCFFVETSSSQNAHGHAETKRAWYATEAYNNRYGGVYPYSTIRPSVTWYRKTLESKQDFRLANIKFGYDNKVVLRPMTSRSAVKTFIFCYRRAKLTEQFI